ncbi:MAG: type VI-B CRISPR-associated RNA-guided ribonuclease Cas13b [Saprospiraceae bacterium]
MADHPFYFGHYINQARHNAYVIMADINEQFELPAVETEDLNGFNPLLKLLTAPKQPDVTGRLVAALTRHFPFLRYLTLDADGNSTQGADPLMVKFVLAASFEMLRRLRNYYSHFGHEEVGNWIIQPTQKSEPDFPFPLSEIYEAAVHFLKPRYSYYTREHLDALRPEAGNDAPNNPVVEDHNEKALVFFTCMFLQRDEATRFFSRLSDFQDTSNLPRRAMLDAYREFCCKLPRPKLESGDIMLDMFNELARCPKPLFAALGPEDRQKFEYTPETDEDAYETDDLNPALLIRHSDRFPWFALRYFDDLEIFPSLRFHVQLGKFATKRYPKEMNEVERERVWLQPIRTFARWKKIDVTDLRRKLDAQSDDQQKSDMLIDKLPPSWLSNNRGVRSLRKEIEQFSSSYLLDTNSIGFRFVSDADPEGFPELPPATDDNGRIVFPESPRPDAVLSTYDLPAMFLHQHLHGAEQTEAFIKDYIERFQRLSKDIKSGALTPPETDPGIRRIKPADRQKARKEQEIKAHEATRDRRSKTMDAYLREHYNLPLRYLPDAFREYLLGYQPNSYRYDALEKLKAKKKETRRLLKGIGYVEDDRKELYLPSEIDMHKAPRSGEMGSWLADDMVFFKPPIDGRLGKPNDAQYKILQKMLAYFGANTREIPAYFQELGLTGQAAAAPHPFLNRVRLDGCNDILTFYDRYLWARHAFIDEVIHRIDPYFGKKPPENKTKQGIEEQEIREKYGHVLRIREKSAQEKQYGKVPVFLPRGLFNDANAAMLRATDQTGRLQSGQFINTIYGFELLFNSDAQPMYGWNRFVLPPGESGDRGEPIPHADYLKDLPKRVKKAPEEEKRALQKEGKRLLDREQEIRFSLTQDRALWMMALARADKDNRLQVDFDTLSLSGIDQVLKEEIDIQLPLENAILSEKLPIRRYGDLRRHLKDRRLMPLFRHFQEERTVTLEEIRTALEEYERRRIPFFERIYKFEQIIFEQFEADVRQYFQNRPKKESDKHLSHRDYLGAAFGRLPDPDAMKSGLDQLVNFRNKLIHNEVPTPDMLFDTVDTASCKELVTGIFNQAEACYSQMLHLLGLPKITLSRHEN